MVDWGWVTDEIIGGYAGVRLLSAYPLTPAIGAE